MFTVTLSAISMIAIADLRGTIFSVSQLTDVNFSGADLSYAFLDQAMIERANFDDVNLTEVMMLRQRSKL